MLVFEIIIVAISFTFLLAWGYVKQQRQTQELLEQLYKKSEKKIIQQFTKEEILTVNEIELLIQDIKASLFWSKKKVQIQETKYIVKDIIKRLENNGSIIQLDEKGPKRYRLEQS